MTANFYERSITKLSYGSVLLIYMWRPENSRWLWFLINHLPMSIGNTLLSHQMYKKTLSYVWCFLSNKLPSSSCCYTTFISYKELPHEHDFLRIYGAQENSRKCPKQWKIYFEPGQNIEQCAHKRSVKHIAAKSRISEMSSHSKYHAWIIPNFRCKILSDFRYRTKPKDESFQQFGYVMPLRFVRLATVAD